jgi:perosamine synthetase
MIATINSVRMAGLKPVLVDVNRGQLTLDLATIRQATTEKTKAVLHVSLNNRHTDLAGIAEYCHANNIALIEDAAQSLGAKIDGKHIGTFGKVGCFSLSTPKIISTGQGGFLITDDSDLARKLGMSKNFGRKCGGIDVFETFGINAKFTDIQAVIGLEQMKKLPGRVERLQEIWTRYYSKLHKYMIPPTYDGWLPWFVDVFITDRDALVEFLKVHNVQTRPTYPEIHKTPMYDQDREFPVSEYVSANGLFLPTHTCLKNEEIDYVCKLIEFYLS